MTMRIVQTENFKKAYMNLDTLPGDLETPGEISKDILPFLTIEDDEEESKNRKKNKKRKKRMKDRHPSDGGSRMNDRSLNSMPQSML